MKKLFLISVFFAVSTFAVAQSGNYKIGFINSDRLVRDSPAGNTMRKKIEADFAVRFKELEELANQYKIKGEKLERDANVMSTTEKNKLIREVDELKRDVERKNADFRDDVNRRQSEDLRKFFDRARTIIASFAEKEKYDLIVQDAAYINPKYDITDSIIKLLDK